MFSSTSSDPSSLFSTSSPSPEPIDHKRCQQNCGHQSRHQDGSPFGEESIFNTALANITHDRQLLSDVIDCGPTVRVNLDFTCVTVTIDELNDWNVSLNCPATVWYSFVSYSDNRSRGKSRFSQEQQAINKEIQRKS